MKINCRHGYFKFSEIRSGELSEFSSRFGLSLARVNDYFTFSDLELAPDFSIKGAPYLTGTSTKTFAGRFGDIFEANGFVYNYDSGLIVPITSITQRFTVTEAGNYYVSQGLILPGAVTDDGSRVMDYAAWYSADTSKFKYSEVGFVD